MAKKKHKKYREDNGQGSLFFDKNKNQFRLIMTIYQNGERKRKAFYGKTEEECRAKHQAYLEREGLVEYEFSIESTIPDILNQIYHMDFKKGISHDAGYFRNTETVKKIESGSIGKMPIKDISRLKLEKYLTEISVLSQSYIDKIWQACKLAYNTAEYNGIVQTNHFSDPALKKPKSLIKTKDVQAFTLEEQHKFVKELLTRKLKKGACDYSKQFLIEMSLGMRMGEINALTTNDIIFNTDGSGVIDVNKTISSGKGYKAFLNNRTKTKAGTRMVEFDTEIGKILKQAIEEYKPNKYNLIFYNHQNDALITTSQVNSNFKRICEKIGVQSYGQHMLRHTFATRCIENGVPAEVLSKWLGHEKITTTLDTYVDVFKKHEEKYSKSKYNLTSYINFDTEESEAS